jgi:hypothetical protein
LLLVNLLRLHIQVNLFSYAPQPKKKKTLS